MSRHFGLPSDVSKNGVDVAPPIWPLIAIGFVAGVVAAIAMVLF
jgi:hypothetical protein